MATLAVLKRQLEEARTDAHHALGESNYRDFRQAMDRELAVMGQLIKLLNGKPKKAKKAKKKR